MHLQRCKTTIHETVFLSIVQNHHKILNTIAAIEFSKLKEVFNTSLKNQCKFYKIHMDLFEKLLLFMRESREKNWELHLYSLDKTNYACMTPFYLSQMHELKAKDTRTWKLLTKSQFWVSKSDVSFTTIGLDHGIKQKNCALKVLRGIKGIVNSFQTLEQSSLIAPDFGNMVKDFLWDPWNQGQSK